MCGLKCLAAPEGASNKSENPLLFELVGEKRLGKPEAFLVYANPIQIIRASETTGAGGRSFQATAKRRRGERRSESGLRPKNARLRRAIFPDWLCAGKPVLPASLTRPNKSRFLLLFVHFKSRFSLLFATKKSPATPGTFQPK